MNAKDGRNRPVYTIKQDRNIVELVLDEKLDDVKARLPAEDRDRLAQFESDINKAIRVVTAEIFHNHWDIKTSGVDRKTFALEKASSYDKFIRPILFRIFDEDKDGVGLLEMRDLVCNTIRNNLGRTAKYEEIRDAWFPGVTYNANAN